MPKPLNDIEQLIDEMLVCTESAVYSHFKTPREAINYLISYHVDFHEFMNLRRIKDLEDNIDRLVKEAK